jgi:hypothetical protein
MKYSEFLMFDFGFEIPQSEFPACATYLRPPKRGLRVGGSRFGEGRRNPH